MRKKSHPPGKDLALDPRTLAGRIPAHGLTKALQLLTELKAEWKAFSWDSAHGVAETVVTR